ADVDRKRGTLRAGATPSIARPDRARQPQIVLYSPERRAVAGDSGEASRAGKNHGRIRGGRSGLGNAGTGRLAWDGAKRVARIKTRQLDKGRGPDAEGALFGDCDLGCGSPAGNARKSTISPIDCRTTRTNLLER